MHQVFAPIDVSAPKHGACPALDQSLQVDMPCKTLVRHESLIEPVVVESPDKMWPIVVSIFRL